MSITVSRGQRRHVVVSWGHTAIESEFAQESSLYWTDKSRSRLTIPMGFRSRSPNFFLFLSLSLSLSRGMRLDSRLRFSGQRDRDARALGRVQRNGSVTDCRFEFDKRGQL